MPQGKYLWGFLMLLTGVVGFAQTPTSSPATTSPLATNEAKTEAELKDWCRHLSKELRSVRFDKCTTRPWVIDGYSVQGRPIPYLIWEDPVHTSKDPQIAPVSSIAKGKSEGRRILILGSIHGDEITSVSVVFRWLEFLDRVKADSFLRKNRYMALPLVNPDGFWAKPRKRVNANGVDINRNFASLDWDKRALEFWLTKTKSDPRRNPGKKAASEPETMLVQKWITQFSPDLIISVHAPYSLLDHDGPIEFPNSHSPLPVRALGAYPGSLGTFAGLEKGIPVVTPEFPHATQILSAKALEDLFVFIMKAKY